MKQNQKKSECWRLGLAKKQSQDTNQKQVKPSESTGEGNTGLLSFRNQKQTPPNNKERKGKG